MYWDFSFFLSQQYHHEYESVFWRRKIRNQKKRCPKKKKKKNWVSIINRNTIWPRPVCQTKNWQTQLKGRFPSGSKAMWNYPCLLNLSLHFTLIIPSDPWDLLANCFSSFYFIMFDITGKSCRVALNVYALRNPFKVLVNNEVFLSSKRRLLLRSLSDRETLYCWDLCLKGSSTEITNKKQPLLSMN